LRDGQRVEVDDEAGLRAADLRNVLGARQAVGLRDHARVAVLGADHSLQAPRGLAALQGAQEARFGARARTRDPCGQQHLDAERDGALDQIRGPAAP
jgi:hypothetical protein